MIDADANTLPMALAALVLLCVTLALAAAVVTARALFAACVCTILLAAAAAAVLLAQDATLPALALAIFGAALLPIWLLASMLLSGNAVKARRRGGFWLSLAAAAAAAALTGVLAPEMAVTHAVSIPAPSGLAGLLATLLFATAVSAIGLLGYGERGTLERRSGAP